MANQFYVGDCITCISAKIYPITNDKVICRVVKVFDKECYHQRVELANGLVECEGYGDILVEIIDAIDGKWPAPQKIIADKQYPVRSEFFELYRPSEELTESEYMPAVLFEEVF